MRCLRILGLAGWVLLSACRFDASVPSTANIRCAGNTDCPAQMRCQTASRRCVDPAAFDELPPTVVAGSVELTFVPGRDNPLVSPTAAGPLSTARLRFEVSEPLAAAPAFFSDCALACTQRPLGAQSFEVSCDPKPGLAPTERDCTLEVELVDLAENRAREGLRGFPLDGLSPVAPDLQAPGALVYELAPWGSVADGPGPRYRVSGAGAVAPGAQALLLRSGTLSRGQAAVDATGALVPTELNPLFTTVLEVAAVDHAGNTSPYSRVHEGRWVVSLAGSSDPLRRLEAVTALGPALERDDARLVGPADGVDAPGGAALTLLGAASFASLDWPGLLAGDGSRAVYDPARARVVVYGGMRPRGFLNSGADEVCELAGAEAACVDPVPDPESDGNPASRSAHVLVFDTATRRVLLHGGQTLQGKNLSDTWAWDGHSWRLLATGPALAAAAGFFDIRRQRLVMTGGSFQDGGASGATWEFDGVAWQPGPAAPELVGAAGVYDPWRGRGFVTGGELDGGTNLETWSYDGTGWTLLADAGVPSACQSCDWAWDPSTRRAVLGNFSAFDGQRWAALDAGSGAPPLGHLVFDVGRHRALVVNGQYGTFASESNAWTSLGASQRAPAPGTLACPAGDVAPGCLLLTGGGATHALTSTGWMPWRQLPNLSVVLMGWLFGDGALLALSRSDGGAPSLLADLLERDGGWTDVADPPPISAAPYRLALPTAGGAALFDDGRGFGSQATTLVYEAVSNTWSQSSLRLASNYDAYPVAACGLPDGGALVQHADFRTVDNSIVPVGGALVTAADGGRELRRGSAAPFAIAAVGHEPRRSVYAFGGGTSSFSATQQLFELGDGGWLPVALADPEGDGSPPPRIGGQLQWSAAREAMVLHGGYAYADTIGVASPRSDTWALVRSPHRPAGVLRLSPLNLPGEGTPRVTRLGLRAIAGGDGRRGGAPAAGVEVLLFVDGRWQRIGAGTAGAGQPADFTVELNDPSTLATATIGHPDLAIAVATEGTNGEGTAQLTLDALEARVDFTLP